MYYLHGQHQIVPGLEALLPKLSKEEGLLALEALRGQRSPEGFTALARIAG